MNVLTQDQARQFLNHSNPSDKYKFFMKGTQLEALDNDYSQMEADLENIDLKIKDRNMDIFDLKRKADEAQKILEIADRQQGLHEKLQELSRQMAWSQVETQEDVSALQASFQHLSSSEPDESFAETQANRREYPKRR